MQRTILITLSVIGLSANLNTPTIWAAPAPTTKSSKGTTTKNWPRVTRDNFVSLRWEQNSPIEQFGRIETQTIWLQLQGNVLSYSTESSFPGGGSTSFNVSRSVPLTRGISNHQLDSLITRFNTARIPAIAGNYGQPNFSQGTGELLILTISDQNDQDQQFILQNHASAAPQAYFDFMTAVRSLATTKFRDNPLTTPTPATADATSR